MKLRLGDKRVDRKISHEKILICIALVLCACVIGYNAFFIPEISIPTVIYADNSTDSKINSTNEEYTPETSKPYESSEVSQPAKTDSSETVIQTDHQNGLVNINTANARQLADELPGVGDVIAQRIIEYRETNGAFSSIEELMKVKGIGEKMFDKLKDLICI